MSVAANSPENDGMQTVPATPSGNECASMSDIPRRLMRVKVLYTFDDQNKSNCLARLPNALNIPTVSLDETTEVGVIELRNCIQAIAAASPELVAKLDHDYTVYAYDYSEYETPLVGQGMLSWILASASASPNAPAGNSQTMVTGRVCKNILGLFSNGIKETLEVKLKLIPVPTCKQKEYVESMERYHSLSKVMPEGLDYSAWADFLKANPAIGQLACPTPEDTSRGFRQTSFGGVDSIHEMLTRPMPRENSFQQHMFSDQFGMSFNTQETAPPSPSMSIASYNPYFPNHDSRPVSRASFRSDSVAQPSRRPSMRSELEEQQEEGPAKKRVRLTQAKRPKKAAIGANTDSLRVTASTAASVRLHRPVAINSATPLASVEQVPRAPTPRPTHSAVPQPHGLRIPAPSLLRHASIDAQRPYVTPYEPSVFSDAAVESAEEDRGCSPGETPMDMPSSPPVMPQRSPSSAPSSPGLPTLPYPADSGFVSDIAPGRDEDDAENGNKIWEGSDLPIAPDLRIRHQSDISSMTWTEVNPGPVELLPKSYIPKPKTYPRPRSLASGPSNVEKKGEDSQQFTRIDATSANGNNKQNVQSAENEKGQRNGTRTDVADFGPPKQAEDEQVSIRATTSPPAEVIFGDQIQRHHTVDQWQQFSTHTGSYYSNSSNISNNTAAAPSRSTTPNPPPAKRSRTSKPRGLPRSHTWSGGPMSDAAGPSDGPSRQPRSGSGAKRRQNITNKLNEALKTGEMPDFCNNCGEIETPTWRKAYTRVEDGEPTNVELSTVGNGIVGFDIIEPTSEDGPKYRIFKQILDQEEKEAKTYTSLILCNPCGLWLNKKGSMRPEQVWAKKQADPEKPKRKRKPTQGSRKKAKGNHDYLRSDAIVPHSEPIHCNPEGHIDSHLLQPMDDATAQAALQRAIQSSPVGFRGSQASPIDVDPDLTPKPTRRLLFPSPRKVGEAKLLGGAQAPISPKSKAVGPDSSKTNQAELCADAEGINKENLPPLGDEEGDDLAHLFEESASPNKTPTKGQPFQDLLKTPTPGSRRRIPLTPKHGADNSEAKTPSRNILAMTPNRSGRTATIAPETPFTRQLNALMSDCMPSSPSQAFDFSSFPTFNTPGRTPISGTQFADLMNNDFLSSDLPIPSSPPGGLGFSLYEDPETSTVGLWSGASIFNSDPIRMEESHVNAGSEIPGSQGNQDGGANGSILKINGLRVDFGDMIEEVIANSNQEEAANTNVTANPDDEKIADTPAPQTGDAKITVPATLEADGKAIASAGREEEARKSIELGVATSVTTEAEKHIIKIPEQTLEVVECAAAVTA